MHARVKVAVIGAGITGISSAVAIQKKCKCCDVTIITDKLSPDTTSDGAAGLWWPYLIGGTSTEDICNYSGKTFSYLTSLWKTPLGGKLGVSLMPCVCVTDTPSELPPWKDVVFGFQQLTHQELQKYNKPEWKQGFRFVTYTCEGRKLMPYLLQDFYANGGKLMYKKLNSLDQLENQYDVVINCTGLGSRELVGDNLVHPIRGQIHRVHAPWHKSILLDESDNGNYVIPNQDFVVLGGTHQKDNWNTSPNHEDAKFITNGCAVIFPSLEKAKVLSQWVGLRPGRPSLRLEKETRTVHNKPITVIHNYGHGGSGLTLFWGCAQRVADILDSVLSERGKAAPLSAKL